MLLAQSSLTVGQFRSRECHHKLSQFGVSDYGKLIWPWASNRVSAASSPREVEKDSVVVECQFGAVVRVVGEVVSRPEKLSGAEPECGRSRMTGLGHHQPWSVSPGGRLETASTVVEDMIILGSGPALRDTEFCERVKPCRSIQFITAGANTFASTKISATMTNIRNIRSTLIT